MFYSRCIVTLIGLLNIASLYSADENLHKKSKLPKSEVSSIYVAMKTENFRDRIRQLKTENLESDEIKDDNTDRFRIRNEELMYDNNYRLGDLDTLVLKQAMLAKGFGALKQELIDHVFDNGKICEAIPPVYISRPNPYIIEQTCTKNDNSAVSKELFYRLYRTYLEQVAQCFDGNRLNEKREAELWKEKNHTTTCAGRIDYCTYAIAPDNSFLGRAETVSVLTEFYHKQSVLNELEKLQQ